jgi:alkane 1-monooxygenase
LRRWQREPLDDGHPQIFPGDHAMAPASASASTRYQCTDCGYIYDEAVGCPHEGFAAGTRWSQIPDDWACPDCAVRDKVDFRRVGDTAVA